MAEKRTRVIKGRQGNWKSDVSRVGLRGDKITQGSSPGLSSSGSSVDIDRRDSQADVYNAPVGSS